MPDLFWLMCYKNVISQVWQMKNQIKVQKH